MDRLPRDQSLHNRIEHKKAQVKSQLAPGQHHLIDDLVDFVVGQMNQSRDVVTVLTGSAQLRRHEAQSTATSDPNCSSREQSIPLVVSTPQPQSSLQSTSNDIKQEEANCYGQTAVLFGPIKTEFDSSSSSSSESNSAVSVKQEFKEEIKEELEDEIVEHSDDDDCDCSECELEVKRKVDSEDDDDQLNRERAVKRQRTDEQMNVQDGMVRSNGGDCGGEGDLDGGEQVGVGELIDEEQMANDDDDNLASNQMDNDRGDGDGQIDASTNGQMENVNGDRDNSNRSNQAGTSAAAANQQVTLPAENFVKQIEPDQFGNRFECDYESCGIRMKRNVNLIRHIQAHIGNKAIKARSVNGPSSQGRTLRSTESTPTQPPSTFEPDITETEHCVKTVFKSQWSRRSTSTTYQCRNYGDCTLVTKNLNHFRIHQRTHSGVKPFKCSVSGCEFAAGLKGSVRDHVKKVHFPNLKKDSTFYDRYIETNEELLNSNPTWT